ncbi:GNAT family N-acetyltransferase [Thiosulfativibrio zosterae]|uniref:N-acetyltransferase domain-containing protein n=1 Tax=Thiosulfativibrio zosterae TaxID=2675053 RepID=A0A6F8PMD4_9GAMM|nr:GNAT family N-acetyltransferase [Thiosulfativibrio zosterae]BBP43271.1 hypothetical protein THMIRHAT_10170 [Thiosulfativibrio zosterae]
MPHPRSQLNKDLIILQADDLQKRLGNQFLKNHKQTPAGKQDELFVVKNTQQTLIGAARLEWIDHAYWLRNVYIEENSRRQGIGSTLIMGMQYVMGTHPTYCFAYEHLTEFYEKLGFNTISDSVLPVSLKEKFQRYLNQDKKICAMQFSPKPFKGY